MSKKAFMIQGSSVSQVNPDFKVENKLPVGVYDIIVTRFGIHLEKVNNEFVFPYKIYGLQTDFINHVIKTYENTTGNLGVLMNGIKGTGKTVCAKILANMLQLPVVILKHIGDDTMAAVDYVSTLPCDCIIFMDEFEKNFPNDCQEILQMMDGVYNSEFRKIFLLTTNELNVNDNLLGRPSRIRYVKQFGNLDKATLLTYGKWMLLAAAISSLFAVIANWDKMNPVQKIIGLLGALSAAALAAAVAFGVFHSAWSIGLAVAGIVAGIAAATAAVAAAGKDIGSEVSFGSTSSSGNYYTPDYDIPNYSGSTGSVTNNQNDTYVDNSNVVINIEKNEYMTEDEIIDAVNKGLKKAKLARS